VLLVWGIALHRFGVTFTLTYLHIPAILDMHGNICQLIFLLMYIHAKYKKTGIAKKQNKKNMRSL
jgi:hypothetical protein